MDAVHRPGTVRTPVCRIVEEHARFVAEFAARLPIEPRVDRARMLLRDLRRFPVLDEEDGMAPRRAEGGDGRVEVDVELIPAKDRQLRVVTCAAAFLRCHDYGVIGHRGRQVETGETVTGLVAV